MVLLKKRQILLKNNDLQSILNSMISFSSDTYFHFATLERVKNENKTKIFFSFSIPEVLNKKQNLDLISGDLIKIYSNKEVEDLLNKFNKSKKIQFPEIKLSEENDLPNAGSIIDLVRGLVVRVEGEVAKPGEYLLAGAYKLKDVFDVSGGVSNGADSKISIVEPSSSDDGSIRLSTSLLIQMKKMH